MDTGGVRSASDVLKLVMKDPESKLECGCCYKVPEEVMALAIQEMSLIHVAMGTIQEIVDKGPIKEGVDPRLSAEDQIKNVLKNSMFVLTMMITSTHQALKDVIRERELKFTTADKDKIQTDLLTIVKKYRDASKNQEDKI